MATMKERLLPIPIIGIDDFARFMEKILKTETCWLWQAYCGSKGYGVFVIGQKHFQAHRVSWRWHFKEDPGNNLVLHTCNTPACVNPTHLYLGNNTDNQQQCEREGRRNKCGEFSSRAKLRDTDVLLIRKLRDSGVGLVEIWKQFSWVSVSTISSVIHNHNWKHLL